MLLLAHQTKSSSTHKNYTQPGRKRFLNVMCLLRSFCEVCKNDVSVYTPLLVYTHSRTQSEKLHACPMIMAGKERSGGSVDTGMEVALAWLGSFAGISGTSGVAK
jgi:hypothetical protein